MATDRIAPWLRNIMREAEAKGPEHVVLIDQLESTIRSQLDIAYRAGQEDVRRPIRAALGGFR